MTRRLAIAAFACGPLVAAERQQWLTMFIGVISWRDGDRDHFAAIPWVEETAEAAHGMIVREFGRRYPKGTITTLRVEPVARELVEMACRPRGRII